MSVRVVATALAVAGAVLVTIGAGMIYVPAGFIVGGGVLLAVGVDALRPTRGGA